MGNKYLLGIDVGTYETKGVLTTVEGEVVSIQVNPHTISIPKQGWVEHDPEAVWWGDFVSVTKKLLADTGIDPKDILAIGTSAIAPDCLPVDENCNPLRKGGILYGIDTRAAAEIDELNEKIGYDKIFDKCANTLSAQAVGPKILWLKKNEPDAYQKAYKFVTATTFIIARLTGNYVIDHLTASFWVPLYDFAKQNWSEELCEGIVEIERLPKILWTSDIAGTVTKDAAAKTGLAEGTPVIVGTADAASEAVSVGTVKPGQMMLMYGSTIFMFAVQAEPKKDERLWATPYVFEGMSTFAAGMATSGALTRWFKDQLSKDLVEAESNGGPNGYGELVKEIENVPAGSEGLVVLPYFSGERTPINDPRARGVFFGLTLSHSRAHMFRAVLEGTGYGVRHHTDLMKALDAEPEEMIAVGGGTKNPIWLQAVSDITGLPQIVPAITVGASYGDAFLAGYGAGIFKSPLDINNWIKDKRIVEPNKDLYPLYSQYMKIYLELYERNKDLMHEIYNLMA